MLDLERRFESLDRLDGPDLWTNIEHEADDRLSRVATRPRVSVEHVAKRGVLVAAGVAVVIIVVIGLATWLLVGTESDTPPVITQDTTPTSLPSTLPETTLPQTAAESTIPPVVTTLPSAPATLLEGTWEHDTSATLFGPGQVFETSLGLVGTGWREGIFLSQDGIEWSLVLALPQGEIIEDAALEPGEPPIYTIESSVGAVAEFKGEVFAFVRVTEDAHGPNSTSQGFVYRTTDGINWEGAPYQADEPNSMAVAGDNELLVILSSDASSTPIMRSEDGLSWTRHETGLDFGYSGEAIFVDGRYLAVVNEPGSADYPWGKSSMAESSDGIDWEVIAGSDFRFNEFPTHLTEYDGRLYMGGHGLVGNDTPQQGMIFYSDDGATWQRAVLPDLANLRFVTILVPTEYGLMAVGRAMWSEDLADRLVVMTTADGSTFTEMPHPAGLFDGITGPGTAYVVGDRIMIRGHEHEPSTMGDPHAVVASYHRWIWTPNS